MKIIKRKKLIIFILILFISIGFAYLSTTLNIAGLIGYKGNTWDVHFENVQVIQNIEGTERPAIANDNLSVDFNVSLSEPSEYYEFYIDVVNDGTIDAMIDEVIKSGITSTNSDYLDFNVTYINGNNLVRKDLLSHGTKVRLDIVVEYKYETTSLAPIGTTNFSLNLKYVQATDDANEVEIITESEENTTFVLNNVKANTLSNLKIYGNTKQANYSGKNLYNYQDTLMVCNGCVADNDGWITIVGDNTDSSNIRYYDYYTNNLNVVENRVYLLVLEIKEVSGNGIFYITSWYDENGQFYNKYFGLDSAESNSITSYKITSRSDYNGTNGLRSFLKLDIGQSGTITFRISVYEYEDLTLDNFVYEPYVGEEPSPNPDYPQVVHNVNDNIELSFKSKNLLDYNNLGYYAKNQNIKVDSNGYVYDSTPDIDQRAWTTDESNWNIDLSPGTYRLTLYFDQLSTNSSSGSDVSGDNRINIYLNSTRIVDKSIHRLQSFSSIITVSNNSNLGILIKSYNGTYRIQLEEGNTSTDWVPFEKKYYLNFNNIELNGIGDYRDYIYNKDGEWYIHRNINKHIFNNENISSIDDNRRWMIKFSSANIPSVIVNNFNVDSNYTNAYCDILLVGTQYDCSLTSNNRFGYSQWGIDSYVYFSRNVGSDSTEVKSNLYGHYMVYPLKDSYEELIRDTTLINQLNAIISDNLYEGTNIITISGNDLAPTVTFDYVTQ